MNSHEKTQSEETETLKQRLISEKDSHMKILDNSTFASNDEIPE